MRTLAFVGLGLDPVRHATIEALAVLAEAEVAFVEGLDARVRDFLKARCARLEDVPSGPPRRVALALLRRAAAARSAAYVSASHPLLACPAALELARLASARGVEVFALGAVSALSAALAAAGEEFGGEHLALQAFDAAAVLAGRLRPGPTAAAVLYGMDSLDAGARRRLSRRLLRCYPRGRRERAFGSFLLLAARRSRRRAWPRSYPPPAGESAAAPFWVEG